MIKTPQIGIITDLHLKEDNIEEVSFCVKQAIITVKNFGLKNLYIAGDIFNSRKAQPLIVLTAWMDILNYAFEEGIELRCIPGNHDKPIYTEERSFLDVYKKHPSMNLVRDWLCFLEEDLAIHMIPFFDEKKSYSQYLDRVELDPYRKNILITHIAVNGVRNNDGSEMEDVINTNSLKDFDKIFIGHYHDYQEIGDNVIYIGSLRQNNFGENERKGITLVYDDLSIEQTKLANFNYKKISVDLDTITDKELKQLTREYANSSDNIRFHFTGTKESIKAIDKSKFEKVGIDVKCVENTPNINVDYADIKSFSGFSKEDIKKEWSVFCELNEIEDAINVLGEEKLKEI